MDVVAPAAWEAAWVGATLGVLGVGAGVEGGLQAQGGLLGLGVLDLGGILGGQASPGAGGCEGAGGLGAATLHGGEASGACAHIALGHAGHVDGCILGLSVSGPMPALVG